MGSLKEREKGILKISQRRDLNLRHLREDHTDDHYNTICKVHFLPTFITQFLQLQLRNFINMT